MPTASHARSDARHPFEIHAPLSADTDTDAVQRLRDIGVTDVIVGSRNFYERSTDAMTLNEKIDLLRRYADTVISRA